MNVTTSEYPSKSVNLTKGLSQGDEVLDGAKHS